jgi:lipoprotein signal peptidase
MKTLRLQHIRLVVAAIILSSCVGCDRITKSIATLSLRDNSPQSYLNGVIRFEYALNPGGLLSPAMICRKNSGFVTDFINVGIGPVRTGIFNVADVAVTFGAIAAVLFIQRR